MKIIKLRYLNKKDEKNGLNILEGTFVRFGNRFIPFYLNKNIFMKESDIRIIKVTKLGTIKDEE